MSARNIRERNRPAPEGLRWANGGGSVIGECNGYHLGRLDGTRGTLCGRYGPHTITVDPADDYPICGNCARIAKIPRRGSAALPEPAPAGLVGEP